MPRDKTCFELLSFAPQASGQILIIYNFYTNDILSDAPIFETTNTTYLVPLWSHWRVAMSMNIQVRVIIRKSLAPLVDCHFNTFWDFVGLSCKVLSFSSGFRFLNYLIFYCREEKKGWFTPCPTYHLVRANLKLDTLPRTCYTSWLPYSTYLYLDFHLLYSMTKPKALP